jgi:hypothetical protein
MAKARVPPEKPIESIIAPDIMTGRVLASLRLGLCIYRQRAGPGIKRLVAETWTDDIYEAALDRLIPKDGIIK